MTPFWRIALGTCILTASAVACTTQVDFDGYYGDGPTGTFSTNDAGVPVEGGITGDGSPSTSPMLVKVDPSATMVQTPGQGVGVFTQYEPAGDGGSTGHWYIWWTCDTTLSSEPCDFAITASVQQGVITEATSQGFAASDTLAVASVDGGTDSGAGSRSVTADTTTTTTVQGIRFDTAPGAVVTLSAALGGEFSGSFLFFVQDGQVNGGFSGTLSDPLELQPSSP